MGRVGGGLLSASAISPGFAGTSNVMAAGLYGIPAYGTMAHSFVETFPHEIDSFRAYGRSLPDRSRRSRGGNRGDLAFLAASCGGGQRDDS